MSGQETVSREAITLGIYVPGNEEPALMLCFPNFTQARSFLEGLPIIDEQG